MSKTRTAATLTLAAACGLALAACGTAHRAAAGTESVTITRPNTPASSGFTNHGRAITMQAAVRRGSPVLGRTDADVTLAPTRGNRPLAGTFRVGCNPLPAPLPAATVKRAVERHGIVNVAYDFLPALARHSLVWVPSSGASATTPHGRSQRVIGFGIRGVRVGSPDAKTESYRVGPDEPGVLLELVFVEQRGGRWVVMPQERKAPVIVSEARC